MSKRFVLLVCILLVKILVFSQSEISGYEDPKETNAIVPVEINPINSLENLSYYDQTTLQQKNIAEYNQIPFHTDEEIYRKLMTIPSEIPLSYSKEVGQIVRNFLYNKRDYLTRMLTASQIYFPIFEEAFINIGVPTELKYLAIVESALNPTAKSKMGATGLWQFMYHTAKDEGMNINSYIDERRDVYRSTEYAANYLKKLYSIHNDWFLALAAYNSGSGNVNKARRNSFGYDFWSIKHKLPRETQNYVPIFISIIYCLYYANEYKLFPEKPIYDFTNTVKEKIFNIQSLKYIAELTGSFEEELMQYNPSLKRGIIPQTANGFDLIIPKQYCTALNSSKHLLCQDPYINKQPLPYVPAEDNTVIISESYIKEPELDQKNDNSIETDNRNAEVVFSDNAIVKTEATTKAHQNYKIVKVTEINKKRISHKIRNGENLIKISNQYRVLLSDLKLWNNLKNPSDLIIGNNLIIYQNEKVVKPQYVLNNSPQSSNSSLSSNSQSKSLGDKQIIHTIKKGETLMQLTRLYGVTLGQIIEWNSLNDLYVDIDQEIFIYANQNPTQSNDSNTAETSYTLKNYSYYEANKGDTLQTASVRFNVSLEELKSLNNRDENELLKEGEKIKIPAM